MKNNTISLNLMASRLFISSLIAIPLCFFLSDDVIRNTLPIFRSAVVFVAKDFNLISIERERNGADMALLAKFRWKPEIIIRGQTIHPDQRGVASASISETQALRGGLIAIIFALAWPAEGLRFGNRFGEKLVRILILTSLLLVFTTSIVATLLVGDVWRLAHDALDSESWSTLLALDDFFRDGGDYLVGIGCAWASVYISALFFGLLWSEHTD